MDLILGDLPSVSSTPPSVCLVFSCTGTCSWSGHAVRLCFGKHVDDARFACSPWCVLPCCPWICLSLPYSLLHTPTTVKAIVGVCLAFLLNNGETRWRARIRRLCSTPRVDHFSQVSDHQRGLSGYTLKCSATLQSVNIYPYKREWHLRTLKACTCTPVCTAVCIVGISDIWGLKSTPMLRIQRDRGALTNWCNFALLQY